MAAKVEMINNIKKELLENRKKKKDFYKEIVFREKTLLEIVS